MWRKILIFCLIIGLACAVVAYSLPPAEVPLGIGNVKNGEELVPSDKLWRDSASRNVLLTRKDLPLRLVQLQELARTGDSRAYCALVASLQQCDESRQVLVKANLEQIGKQSDIIHLNKLLDEVDACKGVPALQAKDLIGLWRGAAESGSLGAVRFYVLGLPFKVDDTVESLSEISLYSLSAERHAITAASNGDFAVSLALADAYYPFPDSTRRSLLGQSVKIKDAAKSLALYRRLQLSGSSSLDTFALVNGRILKLMKIVTPSDLNKAEQSIKSWALPDPSRNSARVRDFNRLCDDI